MTECIHPTTTVDGRCGECGASLKRGESQIGGYARRDRVICALCNALLRFASPHYRAMIGGTIAYGLKAAARDVAITDPALAERGAR